MILRASLLATLAAATSAQAAQATAPLSFPVSARTVAEELEPLGSSQIAVAPFHDGTIETVWAEGQVTRRAWRIEKSAMSTIQILDPLRDQLTEAGFDIAFECETRSCGGFDFRYGLEVFPEPEMHVDLGDFRYLAAEREAGASTEYVALLVSRSAQDGFVQVTRVGPEAATPPVTTSTKGTDPSGNIAPEIGAQLETQGTLVLEGLDFATGSSNLGEGSFPALDELAAYLNAHPDRSVMLVGHTDAMGSLQGNIELSQRRAESVARRLVSDYGVPREQVSAEGIGFLAPRASNLTEEGRGQNRRVEVVLNAIQ